MYFRASLSILLLLAATIASASEPTIDARVDRSVIGIEDDLRLEITVSGGAGLRQSAPSIPAMDGFDVTSAGSSRNMSFVNGKMNSTVTFSYRLKPSLEGRLTIPAITAKIGNTAVATDPMVIEIRPGSIHPPRTQQRQNRVSNPFGWNDDPFSTRRNQRRRQEVDPREHIEIKTTVDRTSAYLGQQVKLTFRMSISPLLRFQSQPQYTPPEVTGAWVEALDDQRTSTERRDNGAWEVVEVVYALFPTTTAPVQVGPAKIEGLVDAGGMDLLSLMRASGHRITLETDPLEISVRTLPEAGRPENFSGAVGDFHIQSQMDRDRGMVNDPFTLSIEIEGNGNPNTVPEPSLPVLDNVRLFDSQSQVEILVNDDILGGTRVFERLLVPQEAGTWIFPELVLDFFDPEQERYRQARSSAIRIEVMPTEAPTGGPIVAGISKEEVKRLKSDIEHIHAANIVLSDHGTERVARASFWLLATLPLLGVGAASTWRRREDRLRSDVAYARSSKAMKTLKRELPKIGSAGDDAHRMARRIFLDYMGNRLNLSSAGLTTEDVGRAMRANGFDPSTVTDTRKLLARFDLAQYSQTGSIADRPDALARDLEELARRIEADGSKGAR